ncbi:Acyl-CoA dehydrogenase, C-terminal domain [Haloechinothrix alba]|uniref:Acyl-CoA dehydrogenase, C-terminal domain n=1 Tax=Haloechinothrix alba TaxID=664784 RepID=A0A238WUM3_9PSEU|nr:Acyl-CoA dehydrogenase, C-terminal domain [Haloechinothrix alba]
MARDAVQAFGGLGFARELSADGTPGPVEAIYRDSKVGEIDEGANEILKWVIARGIFGKEITGCVSRAAPCSCPAAAAAPT